MLPLLPNRQECAEAGVWLDSYVSGVACCLIVSERRWVASVEALCLESVKCGHCCCCEMITAGIRRELGDLRNWAQLIDLTIASPDERTSYIFTASDVNTTLCYWNRPSISCAQALDLDDMRSTVGGEGKTHCSFKYHPETEICSHFTPSGGHSVQRSCFCSWKVSNMEITFMHYGAFHLTVAILNKENDPSRHVLHKNYHWVRSAVLRRSTFRMSFQQI